jgi:hypothetical protein
VGLVGNELVDERARQAALEGSIFELPLSSSDFESMAGSMGLYGYWWVCPFYFS